MSLGGLDIDAQAAARIRELEAELADTQRALLKASATHVKNGTHVIVPVEPTEAMKRAALDYTDMPLKCWQAYIRAAKEIEK